MDSTVETSIGRETLTSGKQVLPIYGRHLVGPESRREWDKFIKSLKDTGKRPNISSWPESTHQELAAVQPSFVGIDAKDYDPLFDSEDVPWFDYRYFQFPGDPYSVRADKQDYYIVDGDFPRTALVLHKSNRKEELRNRYKDKYKNEFETNPARFEKRVKAGALVHQAILDYYETTTDQDVEDWNLPFGKSATKNFDYKYWNDALGTVGLAAASMTAWVRSHMRMNRRQALVSEAVTTAAFVNMLRGITSWGVLDFHKKMDAQYGTHHMEDKQYLYNPLHYPLLDYVLSIPNLLARLPPLAGRNAIECIKLREADQLIETKPEGPLVAVFGTGHWATGNVWNSTQAQEQTAKGNLSAVCTLMKGKESEELDDEFKALARERLTEYFGGTKVWRVTHKAVSDSNTISRRELFSRRKSGKEIVPEKTFVSPSIQRLAREAADEVGFI